MCSLFQSLNVLSLFSSCLHSWLEQVTNCPTCRTPLVNGNRSSNNRRNNILGQDDMQPRPTNQTTNHFFHFDGKDILF